MKYIKLLSVAALALAMSACTGKAQKNGEALAEAEEGVTVVTNDQETEAVNQAPVKDVTADNQWTPRTKVSKLTVLDFNASWCGPCRKFTPVLEKSAVDFGDKIDVYSIDIDNNPETATAFGVEAVPTVIIIRPDGKTVKFVGIEDIVPYEKWEKILNENL